MPIVRRRECHLRITSDLLPDFRGEGMFATPLGHQRKIAACFARNSAGSPIDSAWVHAE